MNTELTSAQIEAGWKATFSTENPFCPCNLKTFTKAVEWAERHIGENCVQRQAQPLPIVGMRDAAYVDSTPRLHVGSSSFEDWYQAHPKACTGDKQLARDAYAAGMGDPLVTYAAPVLAAFERHPPR